MIDGALTPTLSQGAREPGLSAVGELLMQARADLQAAGADSPWLAAVILLEHATGLGRAAVLARPEALPTPEHAAVFQDLVGRRCAREPLAYILGYRDFYGRRFALSPTTLIPRPETELLVETALRCLDRLSDPHPVLLDVGTGSGAIAVSVLAEQPRTSGIATDSSLAALGVAAANATAHGVADRLRLVACDLARAVRTGFSVVVGNLPYVPSDEIARLQPEVASYEPRAALDGGPDGTAVIVRFMASLDELLTPGGVALLEIGAGQAETLVRHATTLPPGYRVSVERDGAGLDRILILERPER
jgi:release factor glutamine methyltransferase